MKKAIYVLIALAVFAACGNSGGSSAPFNDGGNSSAITAQAPPVERDSALVGRWRSRDGTIEFFANGTAVIPIDNRGSEIGATWHTDGGRLFFNYEVVTEYTSFTISALEGTRFGSMGAFEELSFQISRGGGGDIELPIPIQARPGVTGEIYGEWFLPSSAGRVGEHTSAFTFNQDGTGTNTGVMRLDTFTWSINDAGTLRMTVPVARTTDYSVSDSELTIFFDPLVVGAYLSGTQTFSRLGSN
jgi:hypothetical protein